MTAHSHHEAGRAPSRSYDRAFAVGILLNVAFIVIEVVYGLASDSLALIADAGHNLGDVLSLVLAWGAAYLASRSATRNRTYGYRKATILASLISAVLLLFALGGIAWEAVGRFLDPRPVAGPTVIAVAAVGVVINGITAWLFASGSKHDLNIRGAYLHMAADAAVSLGVVVAGCLIVGTGWLWIDPVISLVVVIVVLIGTWSLLRDSMNLALDAVPERIDMEELETYLRGLPPIEQFHDLHVWPLSTTEIALSVHLVTGCERLPAGFLAGVEQELYKRFDIGHATMQVEHCDDLPCTLDRGGC